MRYFIKLDVCGDFITTIERQDNLYQTWLGDDKILKDNEQDIKNILLRHGFFEVVRKEV